MIKQLTPKQLKFCQKFLEHGNASRAYREAGYSVTSEKIASVESNKLLNSPSIFVYIEQRRKKAIEKTGVTSERIINELVSVAFGSLGEVVEISESGMPLLKQDANLDILDGISSSSSSSTESSSSSFSIKRADKVKALDALCKLLGLYERRDAESGRNLEANADRVLSALRRFKKPE